MTDFFTDFLQWIWNFHFAGGNRKYNFEINSKQSKIHSIYIWESNNSDKKWVLKEVE